MDRIRKWSLWPAVIMLSGCAVVPWSGAESVPENAPRYFNSPENAVREISRLLEEQEWRQLSAYYDPGGRSEAKAEFENGDFFRPEVSFDEDGAPPSRRWRPFYPGSKFSHVNATGEADVVEVVVKYETRAEGGLILRGYDSFRMRRSADGWRLLPDGDSVPACAAPVTNPQTPG